MSLSPQVLLTSVARERCISKLKELPTMISPSLSLKSQQAAVLVPICVHNGKVCLLYTLRSSQLKQHSGQVSFPGGKTDNNETAPETALRESEEEIGVPRDSIDIWAEMPQMQGRNKEIIITPVVGLIKNFDTLKLTPNEHEVDEIFKVPMEVFCDNESHGNVKYENYRIPVFSTEKHKVWGITGMITHLFLQCFLPENLYQFDIMNRIHRMDELLPSKL